MINATIIKDSVANGIRITTFELEYPRFIHSELMTHRVFSRNAASSRAIPIAKMNENIFANPAMPIHWGKNQAGMQAKEELDDSTKSKAMYEWKFAKNDAVMHSERLAEMGVHKQLSNRITEPFQHMKTVVTATEWENWYELRAHPDAQPEIQELATKMWLAHIESQPQELKPCEWHLPYVHNERVELRMLYSIDNVLITLEEAKKISVSCCAQVSYRKNDTTLDKAVAIYDKLCNMKPFHASPFEHVASPMLVSNEIHASEVWEPGVTHMDRRGNYWSGNFKGWLQFRQLI